MTRRFVGKGGNDGNSGLSWALRKLTLDGAEDTPVVPGDEVRVGPGVYREQSTVDVDGGNVYNTNTVSVTNGSATVTGAGTAFLANVAIADMFQLSIYASGNDGVANGTATFTSAGGNFQAAMIGQVIQINARRPYRIGAVAAANSITLTDPHGLGWPGAGGGLVYSVMSGQGPYEIESITDDTHFELVRAWSGPTLTGIAYLTYRPIRYIADVTGEYTDGVGGVVRITGTDDDQTIDRVRGFYATNKDYRLFRGFSFDTFSSAGVQLETGCNYITIEDCAFGPTDENSNSIVATGDMSNIIIRRCFSVVTRNTYLVWFTDASQRDDTACLVENCLVVGGLARIQRIGGITFRNCTVIKGIYGVRQQNTLTTGQTTIVENCVFMGCSTAMLGTVAGGEVTEDYNNFWANDSDRSNTATGANSVAYPPVFVSPMLLAGASQISGFKFPWWFGELSEWSQLRAIAGLNEPSVDIFGIARPVTAAKKSWGAVQFQDMERETGTTRGGSTASLALHDAGRHQIWVPVTNVSTTISVYAYREADYAGDLPQMIVKQPNQSDDITTEAAAASQWNLLTTTFTPAAEPPYVVVELVSRNTAVADAFEVFFDDLVVS